LDKYIYIARFELRHKNRSYAIPMFYGAMWT